MQASPLEAPPPKFIAVKLAEIEGFGSVVTRERGAPIARFRVDGRQQSRSVGAALGKRHGHRREISRAEAAKALRDLYATIHTGNYQTAAEGKRLTADILARYLADCEKRHIISEGAECKNMRNIRTAVQHLTVEMGHIVAKDLTKARVDDWIVRRKTAGHKPGTIATRLAYLKAALAFGVENDLLLRMPKSLPSITVKNARQGVMNDAQIRALIAAAEEPLDDVIRFAREVGWRREEIIALTWLMVDRVRHEIRIPDSKNGESQTLPLAGRLAAIIERRWQRRSLRCPFVFHRHDAKIPSTTFSKLMIRARDRARAAHPELAIPADARLHDFRRIFYGEGLASGMSLPEAMKIAHHKTLSSAIRYNIIATGEMRKALDRRAAFEDAGGMAVNA